MVAWVGMPGRSGDRPFGVGKDADEAKPFESGSRIDLDQYVEVAVLARVAAGARTENRKSFTPSARSAGQFP